MYENNERGAEKMGTELAETKEQQNRLYSTMLIIGIIFVAINLRPGLTAIGPLMGIIRDDLGLSNWSVGLLTGLPLIAFSLISPMVPKLGRQLTNERTMILGLLILALGISVRSISMIVFVFLGTILVGLGIATCNVLLPGVAKEKYPTKMALITSTYSTVMTIFAAAASGISIPLADGLSLGWQYTLFFWAIPAGLGAIIWFYLYKRKGASPHASPQHITSKKGDQIWRSMLAWQVALFMGLQAILFYVVISWLPEILIDNGVSITTAGWFLSYTQTIGIPSSFLVPVIADRMKNQRGIVIFFGIASLLGFSGLLLGNSLLILILSTTLIGIVLPGNFALALMLFGLRARIARHAAELSGMAQAVAYILAAAGPVLFGLLYDITKAWTIPIITLLGVTLLVVFFGLRASEDRFVFDKEMGRMVGRG